MKLSILYESEELIAINKPNGLLVHRSPIAKDVEFFALQLLRDQINQHVTPIHRLDRKTSGVLLFAKDNEIVAPIQDALKTANKRYLAIVRGFFPGEITVNHPLLNEKNKLQEAETAFRCLEQVTLPLPFGKHDTSRYSLIEAFPKTGRMHQIRKHCNHLRHPIIGDRPHGCNKQNKLFLETWNHTTMLLHAFSLAFINPFDKKSVQIEAPLPDSFKEMGATLGFNIKANKLF